MGNKNEWPSFRVVEVRVPKSAAAQFERLGRIDGIGEAWFARMEHLARATVRVVP